MEQDTGGAPVRVSLRTARDAVVRLRAALEHLDVRTDVINQVIPASDMNGSHYVRMGTWDPDSVHALADGIEGLAEALEALRRPPLIGRTDAPPLLPPVL